VFADKIEFPACRFVWWSMSSTPINDGTKANGATVDCEILLNTANFEIKSFAEKVATNTNSFSIVSQIKCTGNLSMRLAVFLFLFWWAFPQHGL